MLVNDIRTHISSVQNPETRQIQATGQALKALHFMAALNGENLSQRDRNNAKLLVADSLATVGFKFSQMQGTFVHIGDCLQEKSIRLYEDTDSDLNSSSIIPPSQMYSHKLEGSILERGRITLGAGHLQGSSFATAMDNINSILIALNSANDNTPASSFQLENFG